MNWRLLRYPYNLVQVSTTMGKAESVVAAAVLIGLKVPYAKAVAGVRAARPGSLRNPLQLWFLWMFARRWNN